MLTPAWPVRTTRRRAFDCRARAQVEATMIDRADVISAVVDGAVVCVAVPPGESRGEKRAAPSDTPEAEEHASTRAKRDD